jgi:hypothetical protein
VQGKVKTQNEMEIIILEMENNKLMGRMTASRSREREKEYGMVVCGERLAKAISQYP